MIQIKTSELESLSQEDLVAFTQKVQSLKEMKNFKRTLMTITMMSTFTMSSCTSSKQKEKLLPVLDTITMMTSSTNMQEIVRHCLQRTIHNRGKPKQNVVADIIAFVKHSPDVIFEVNDKYDIYESVKPQLGPYRNLKHRRAVMAETLIVLAGFESSWNYKEGRDLSANNTHACTQEAGIYQTSANSSYFGADLKLLQKDMCGNYVGKSECDKFITCTKHDIPFAHEYTARLLRKTTNHHGPVKRKEINKWLSKECTQAIERIL